MIQNYSKIDGFISAAKGVVDAIQRQRTLFFDRVQEQGRELSSAIDTVINVGLLENDLINIGPGGEWTGPGGSGRNLDNPGNPSDDELRTDVEWFKTHIDYWDDIATEMGALETKAKSTSDLPVQMIDMPHVTAAQSSAINSLADRLETAIAGGHTAAEDMVVALRTTIRNYIDNEASSAGQADAMFNEYFG